MERLPLVKYLISVIILVPICIYIFCYLFLNNPTTVFLVRHADKQGSSDALSAAGMVRANELERILDEADIDVIYASQYNRTQQTANSLATELGLTVQLYDAGDIPSLVDEITTTHRRKRILVVGHSNTIPQTIGQLGFTTPPNIPEDEYDHLYLAILHSKMNNQLIKMEYGADTPNQ